LAPGLRGEPGRVVIRYIQYGEVLRALLFEFVAGPQKSNKAQYWKVYPGLFIKPRDMGLTV
jgi:hypothetical protein